MTKTKVTVDFFKTGSNAKYYATETFYTETPAYHMPDIIQEVKDKKFYDDMNFTVEVENGNMWNKVLVITQALEPVPVRMQVTQDTLNLLNAIATIIKQADGTKVYILNNVKFIPVLI